MRNTGLIIDTVYDRAVKNDLRNYNLDEFFPDSAIEEGDIDLMPTDSQGNRLNFPYTDQWFYSTCVAHSHAHGVTQMQYRELGLLRNYNGLIVYGGACVPGGGAYQNKYLSIANKIGMPILTSLHNLEYYWDNMSADDKLKHNNSFEVFCQKEYERLGSESTAKKNGWDFNKNAYYIFTDDIDDVIRFASLIKRGVVNGYVNAEINWIVR